MRGLADQVERLLVIWNGYDENARTGGFPSELGHRIVFLPIVTNRGTAAAWNTALSFAAEGTYRFLFLLDQDSTPSPDALEKAIAGMADGHTAAVVQPTARDKFGLAPFPWNTVASGSLYDVATVRAVGGFDESLFVDEVDHELLDRLIAAGYQVRSLASPTIQHHAGAPRPIRVLKKMLVLSGHNVERRRLQGRSAGLLVRRYMASRPKIAAQLLLRHCLTAAKDIAAHERDSAYALLSSLLWGLFIKEPPLHAPERACPYCQGLLIGVFGAVPDWRFGTGELGDVYRCAKCGALAAGRVADSEVIASWYAQYYTHAAGHSRRGPWGQLWPTPKRRQEMERLRWYLSERSPAGRFLEVGTGSGERLLQFADAGWDVVGQDLDPQAGHQARSAGITVYETAVGDLIGRERPFDLIGLNHVLEHADDPAELLRACDALLAPGGRLCIVSPNARALGTLLFGRWWFGLEQPRHLGIPTLDSLKFVSAGLNLRATHASSTGANAAVVLGGSLVRPFEARLPPGRSRRAARFATAFIGQGIGRAAVLLDDRLGEE
ncbi:MAG: bifunctional glycosyltransferase/class I SAM-dependent methyltransferase, partial [Actinobacteria bacterium]|nr:bifunctional glycosyltransferase/class I SAM-dependent methyltransferase [Actinomycetota bacterium]